MRAVYHETVDYWSPDAPPATTLFAELGDKIAEDSGAEKNGINSEVFRLIEAAMTSGNDKLVTAVATGLIEAIAARISEDEQMRQRILPRLGEQSRKHLDAWLAG
tara:strand:+ start:317 stop:631 length:315 start_codon:yes stop_codon:yes gene_type:complete